MQQRWKSIDTLEPALRRFLFHRCRDEGEVDDVIQETFLRAARYRASLKEPTRLRSWAFRIAANVVADRIRLDARLVRVRDGEKHLAELPSPASVEDESLVEVDGQGEAREEVLAVLEEALERLRSRDRRLIESFYGGAGSCRETADACSLPEDVVKVRLYRARTRLRDLVTREVVKKRQALESAWSGR